MFDSVSYKKSIQKAVIKGLSPLEVPVPLNLVQWAEEHFYLSAESSYVEQKWETIPWQRGIMMCISNDDIRVINWIKSARVGATKIMLAGSFYFAHHKKRNQIFYQPIDKDAEDFCNEEVDTALRDVPCMKEIFPDLGKQTKNNKVDKKQFIGSTLRIKGGNSGGNFRRMSSDVNWYDELEAFRKDIDGEGSPLTLGDKRLEGSLFPKSVRMTTPKIRHESLIEQEVETSDLLLRYSVPCPHCGEHQVLKWGGNDASFGMKWDVDDPKSVYYLCEHNGCVIHNNDLTYMNDNGIWTSDDGVTLDEFGYFTDQNGVEMTPPEKLSFHIWTAYSPFVTWARLVSEFITAHIVLKKDGDITKLKTFVNTTLGETWEEEQAERLDSDILYARREHYDPQSFPKGGLYIVAGLDMQDDRIEGLVKVFGVNNENWTLDYFILRGDPSQQELWDRLDDTLRKTYKREDGAELEINKICFDSGGHYTTEVYDFCKRFGANVVIPTKGSSTYGDPIINFPRTRNQHGVWLTMIGTDTAKDNIYGRLKSVTCDDLESECAGFSHYPIADFCDKKFFEQLTSEGKERKKHRGKWVLVYDNKGRRNEVLDCEVGCLAAWRIAQVHYGVNPDLLRQKVVNPTKRTTSENNFLEAAKKLRV